MLRQEEDGHRCRPVQGSWDSGEGRLDDGDGKRVLTMDVQAGKGLVKVNGRPLQFVQPEILRFKVR